MLSEIFRSLCAAPGPNAVSLALAGVLACRQRIGGRKRRYECHLLNCPQGQTAEPAL
ncbi:hypothetical protein [Kamptonema formosum]|uniref:hypothetical protein n=1 Tax=Kamptonema formosum TaxID=331992 RepID=UPI0012DF6F6F|nr:hypothetical protein [Oscillatoria sp. PCC 10802]